MRQPKEGGGLVLARREGQRLVVDHAGERLVIELHSIRPSVARLRLAGPRSFSVLREEAAGDRTDDGRRAG